MDPTFDKMTEALKRDGLVAALKVLNDRVPHRYSAVYRLSPDGDLFIVAFVDKQCEPCPAYLLCVPYNVSFCQFTIKHGMFRTNDSSIDERLDGHPYQDGWQGQGHGLPLRHSGHDAAR